MCGHWQNLFKILPYTKVESLSTSFDVWLVKFSVAQLFGGNPAIFTTASYPCQRHSADLNFRNNFLSHPLILETKLSTYHKYPTVCPMVFKKSQLNFSYFFHVHNEDFNTLGLIYGVVSGHVWLGPQLSFQEFPSKVVDFCSLKIDSIWYIKYVQILYI